MAFVRTHKVTIQDLIDYLNQFPKDAVICTHNSYAWCSHKVYPISKSDMEHFISKVNEPIDDNGKPLKDVFVSIHDWKKLDY